MVLNLNEGTVAYNNTTNVLTYANQAGTATILNLNNTGLTYDPATAVLSYVNTLGTTQTVDLSGLVQAESGVEIHEDKVKLGGSLTRTTTILQNGNPLTIATGGDALTISGLDKTASQASGDYLLAVGAGDQVKALKAAMPKFFYMPSMVLPLADDQIVPTMHATYTAGTFTIDLHAVYTEQFGGTNPGTSTSNPTKTTTLPILPKGELDYYITFFDDTVYTNVAVDDNGMLTYRISPTADPTFGSFMNVVFAIKP